MSLETTYVDAMSKFSRSSSVAPSDCDDSDATFTPGHHHAHARPAGTQNTQSDTALINLDHRNDRRRGGLFAGEDVVQSLARMTGGGSNHGNLSSQPAENWTRPSSLVLIQEQLRMHKRLMHEESCAVEKNIIDSYGYDDAIELYAVRNIRSESRASEKRALEPIIPRHADTKESEPFHFPHELVAKRASRLMDTVSRLTGPRKKSNDGWTPPKQHVEPLGRMDAVFLMVNTLYMVWSLASSMLVILTLLNAFKLANILTAVHPTSWYLLAVTSLFTFPCAVFGFYGVLARSKPTLTGTCFLGGIVLCLTITTACIAAKAANTPNAIQISANALWTLWGNDRHGKNLRSVIETQYQCCGYLSFEDRPGSFLTGGCAAILPAFGTGSKPDLSGLREGFTPGLVDAATGLDKRQEDEFGFETDAEWVAPEAVSTQSTTFQLVSLETGTLRDMASTVERPPSAPAETASGITSESPLQLPDGCKAHLEEFGMRMLEAMYLSQFWFLIFSLLHFAVGLMERNHLAR
ncbi:hypothetical protein HDU77_011418 [Chytriomyces hyalinus]|nr:hypothetical protein HDU77_011418 [Chytriomyces hyalinus]